MPSNTIYDIKREKRNMKKIGAIFLAAVLVLMCTVPVYAEGYNVRVVFDIDKEEMPDVNLYRDDGNIRTDDNYIYVANADGTLSVYNRDSEPITEHVYPYSENTFHDGLLRVSVPAEDGTPRYGCIDDSGNVVIDIAYTELGDFKDGKAIGILFGQTVMINTRGEIMHNYGGIYGFFSGFENGFAFVRDEPFSNGKCIINQTTVSVLDVEELLQAISKNANNSPRLSPSLHNSDIYNKLCDNAARCRDDYYIINENGDKVFSYLTAETIITHKRGGGGMWDDPSYYTGDVEIMASMFNKGGTAVIKSGNNYALANLWGELITEFRFESYDYNEECGVIALFDDEADSDGYNNYYYAEDGSLISRNSYNYTDRMKAPAEYESCGYTTIVEVSGRYGVLDGIGNAVIPVAYDSVKRISAQGMGEYFIVGYNGKEGIRRMNSDIDDIPVQYDKIDYINRNYEAENEYTYDIFAHIDGKTCCLRFDGTTLIEPIYDDISYRCEDTYEITQNGKKGLLDKYGSIILEPIYDNVSTDMLSNTNCVTARLNGETYLYDVADKKFLYKGEGVIREHDANRYRYADHDLFIIDKDGSRVIYNALDPNAPEIKYYLVNPILGRGEEARDADFIEPYDNYDVFWVESGGKRGVVDGHNNILIPIEYDHIEDDRDTMIVAKGRKYGMYNRDFELTVPIEYDRLERFGDYLRAELDGKFGFIDFDGNVLVPFELESQEQGSAIIDDVGFNGEYAYGYRDGKVVKYDAKTGVFNDTDFNALGAYNGAVYLDGEYYNYDGTLTENAGECRYERDGLYDCSIFSRERYMFCGDNQKTEYYDKDDNLIYYTENGKTYDGDGNKISDTRLNLYNMKVLGHPFDDPNMYWCGMMNSNRNGIIEVTPK